MVRTIIPVCGATLKIKSDIVRKLDRQEEIFFDVPENTIGIERMKLFVPQGLDVYQVVKSRRNKGELFFCVNDKDPYCPGYLSIVNPAEGGLNYMRNAGVLLRYPWMDDHYSAIVFNRLITQSGNALFSNCQIRNPECTEHPLQPRRMRT